MIFSSLAGISIRRSPFWLVSLVSISLPVVSRSFSYSGNRMSSSFTTERTIQDGTTTISLTPKQESLQSALVVIAHGLGDSADGLADVAEVFAQQLPYCKFILPTAPVQPVTLNGGMPMNSWYDIVGLDERSNESCHGIEDSRKKLMTILQNEHEQTGLPYRRMVLAGFSQGGALSLYTGLQMPNVEQKLAGVCVMSGYLPHAKQFQITQGLEDCPVWHGQYVIR
jgi:lysophospholipase-2